MPSYQSIFPQQSYLSPMEKINVLDVNLEKRSKSDHNKFVTTDSCNLKKVDSVYYVACHEPDPQKERGIVVSQFREPFDHFPLNILTFIRLK
jgi:hypothetical protein